MADPHQDSGQIDTAEVHSVSDNIIILDPDHIDSGIKEGMLNHDLVGGNIDSSTVTYVVPTSSVQSGSPVTVVTDPDDTTSVPSSGSGLGFRSLDELSLHTSDTYHNERSDLHGSTHSHVHFNGSENVLVNTSHSSLLPLTHTAHAHTQAQIADSGAKVQSSEVCIRSEVSLSNDQFSSMSHHLPAQAVQSHPNTNTSLLTDGTMAHTLTHIVQSNDNNQTSAHLDRGNGEDPSQVDDTKTQLKVHTISHTPVATQIAAPSGMSMTPDVLQSVIQQVKAQQLSQHSSQQTLSSSNVAEIESGAQNNGVSITLVSPSQPNSSAAPLGSSQNPIRIIQQGNRYTPMQQLTTEQLQQIMQVVQQQHTNNPSKAQENGGTVIFNPHTNTKIMYRVIYPSELHKSQSSSGQATYQVLKPVTLSQEQQTTTSSTPLQKRPYRKRKEVPALPSEIIVNGEEDKERVSGDGAELSKEEKEERKKHRPRTRSGRVSKPPKHMVQDYKHIHVLDWDEDYDDSDGGYSDLKQSDEDSKARQNDEGEQEASPDLFQALGAGKPKNYKCHACDKSYIGQAGLERHYRLAPDHRRTEDSGVDGQVHDGLLADGEDSSKDASITQDGNSRNSDPGPDVSKVNGFVDNFSEDSNTQDSINSIGASSPVVRRGRGRGSYRGRWSHLKQNAHGKRKNKLREFVKICSDEDLMDVLFPRLVGCISTWEFLLMKAEKGGARPQVDIIYKEFEDLLRPLKKVCAGYMKPVLERQSLNSFDKVIKVHDQNLASCLGLNVGIYKVEEMLPDDSNSFSSLHNKLSAASISLSKNSNAQERLEILNPEKFVFSGKRKYEMTSPSKSGNIPIKKPCLMTSSSSPSNNSCQQSLLSLNGLPSNNSESGSPQTTSNVHLSSLPTHSLQPSVSQSSNFIKVETSSSSQAHPSLSYFVSASNGKGNNAASQNLKPQLVPVVLNTVSGANTVAVSSSQILPVVLNPQSCRTTISSTAPGTRAGQISSLPLLLAAPGNQLQGGAIFIASGNQAASQNVLVKQPSPQIKQNSSLQQEKQIKCSSQHNIASPTLKSEISPVGSINRSNTNGISTVAVSSSPSSSIQRFDINAKPAEVKVSRKLFHEATASSSLLPITTSSSSSSAISSSYVTCGSHSNNTIFVNSPHKVKVNYHDNSTSVSSLLPLPSLTSSQLDHNTSHLQPTPTTCSSLGTVKRGLINEVLSFNSMEFNNRATEGPVIISVSSHATTPVTDLNREVTTGNDEDLDSSFDISAGVLSSIGFSGDELSSLNTSSDNPSSIPVSLPNLGVNQVSSVMHELTAPSSNDVSNGVSLIQTSKAASGNSSSMNDVNSADSPFINGSTSEFPTISPPTLKLKDRNMILPSLQSSSSSFITSTSDFIHLLSNRPSSPLMSSPCKDSNLNNSTASVSFNLTSMDNSPQSQMLKSETNASSMMDLGALSFSDQRVEQLNGVASTLHSSDVDSILPEQITQPDEAVNPLLELPQQLASDDVAISTPAVEEEVPLLLTEGSNIYQTDDGAWFIQSADGITYQLQGAQGLPMETVQALLSGNLDLNGDTQTDVMQ